MLQNLTNFFSLIKGRKIKKQLQDSDLIAVGTRDTTWSGNYQPSAITYKDLSDQLGGGAPVDITYSDLYNKTVNSELSPGQWYRVTDYRSVNFLNGWILANNNPTPTDPSFDPREIYTGDIEVLLVQAVSSNAVSETGYSETFQGDVIEYRPYTNKIGVDFNIYNGVTLPDSSVVSGFDLQWDGTNVYFNMPAGYPALFGHYFYLYCEFYDGVDYYYQDGDFEPLTPGISICQYPYTNDDPDWGYPKTMSRLSVSPDGMKVILLDLTQADYNNYIADSLSINTVYAIGDAYGWVTRRNDTERGINVPYDFRARKYRRYEVEIDGGVNSISYSAPSLTLTDGTYYDIAPYSQTSLNGDFASFNVIVSGGAVISIQAANFGAAYEVGDTLLISGAQIGGSSPTDDVTITVDSIYSNIGYYGMGDNPYINNKYRTTTGNYKDFYSIDWKGYDIQDLSIEGEGGPDVYWYNGYNDNNVFFENSYRTRIGKYPYNNTIGRQFSDNTIGDNFSNNIIGNYFSNNKMGDYITYNVIYDNSYNNVISNNFSNNFIRQYFNENIIANLFYNNTISSNFSNNTIGVGFHNNVIMASFQYNKLGDYFSYNTIGVYFYSNNINSYFYGNKVFNGFYTNIINSEFQNNLIKDNFRYNTTNIQVYSVDFSSATYIYGDYNCTIFKNSVGFLRLSYYDNLDVLTIDNINS